MKEPWILATSEADGGAAAVSLYSRRFTTEENFRDEKDPRYGIGVLNVRLASPARRDRLIQIVSIANFLMTLLGGAGEALGLGRQLRANTVSRRTHSLFRQGREYLRGAVGKLTDGGRALGEAFLLAVKHCKEAHEIYGDI